MKELSWTDFVLLYIQWIRPEVLRIYITPYDFTIIPHSNKKHHYICLNMNNGMLKINVNLLKVYADNPTQFNLLTKYQKKITLVNEQIKNF